MDPKHLSPVGPLQCAAEKGAAVCFFVYNHRTLVEKTCLLDYFKQNQATREAAAPASGLLRCWRAHSSPLS